ncbi:DUF5937 family protein [Streptomyces sp. NPDC051940]|uniref:ArsR/SmtB family transcription factor n=1 Tax=Streptomyces sp. NPDC051940 TaxID=3155675 RepID=UPI0034160A9B
MPSRLAFGAEDLLRLRFAISPLWETHEAARTLRRPDRQGFHLPWLHEIRERSRSLDLTPLWLFMPRSGTTPDFLGPPPVSLTASIEEELALVRGSDPAQALRDMRLSLADTPGAADHPVARRLVADPVRAVAELADLLQETWHVLVEPHWPRLRELLEADVAFHARRLALGGFELLFAELHPKVRWDEGTLTVDNRWDYHRELGGEGLLLLPSAFLWPDVVTGFAPPWNAAIAYPARGVGSLWQRSGPGPREALVRLLGAGRASVLGALDEPASTTALAARLGLAPATVSAHLKALRDAGLLVSRRRRHEVLYERTPVGIALYGGSGGLVGPPEESTGLPDLTAH